MAATTFTLHSRTPLVDGGGRGSCQLDSKPFVGEAYGRLLSPGDPSSDSMKALHCGFRSADEMVAAVLLDEFGEEPETADESTRKENVLPEEEDEQQHSLSTTPCPSYNRRHPQQPPPTYGPQTFSIAPLPAVVCVWKNPMREDNRALARWGIVGHLIQIISSSICSTIAGSPFVSWEDAVDAQPLFRFILSCFMAPINTYSAVSSLVASCRSSLRHKTSQHPSLSSSSHHKPHHSAPPVATRGKDPNSGSRRTSAPTARRRILANVTARHGALCWHPERLLLAEGSLVDGVVAFHPIVPTLSPLNYSTAAASSLLSSTDHPRHHPMGPQPMPSFLLTPDCPSNSSILTLAAEGAATVWDASSAGDDYQDEDGGEGEVDSTVRRRTSAAAEGGTIARRRRSSVAPDGGVRTDGRAKRLTAGRQSRLTIGQRIRKSIGVFMPFGKAQQRGEAQRLSVLDSTTFEALDLGLGSKGDEFLRRAVGVSCVAFKPCYYDTIIAVGFSDGFEVWKRPTEHEGPFTEQWECLFWLTDAARSGQGWGSAGSTGALWSPQRSGGGCGATQCCVEGVTALEWAPDGQSLVVAGRTHLNVWPYRSFANRHVVQCLADTGPPQWLSPTYVTPESFQPTLEGFCRSSTAPNAAVLLTREIADVKWCPSRPVLAVLISDGTLELFDTTDWCCRLWQLPTERLVPVVPRLCWHLHRASLLCANESRLFELSLPDSLRQSAASTGRPQPLPHPTTTHQSQSTVASPSPPAPRVLASPSRNTQRADYYDVHHISDALTDHGMLRTGMRSRVPYMVATSTSSSTAASKDAPPTPTVKAAMLGGIISEEDIAIEAKSLSYLDDFVELPIHPADRSELPIRSFAVDQLSGLRLVLIFADDPHVYVYQYSPSAVLHRQPPLSLIGRISPPSRLQQLQSSVIPLAVEFSRGRPHHFWSPSTSSQEASLLMQQSTSHPPSTAAALLQGQATTTAVLAVRWGIAVPNDCGPSSAPPSSPPVVTGNLAALFNRRNRLRWKPSATQKKFSLSSDDARHVVSRPAVWPLQTCTYPLSLCPSQAPNTSTARGPTAPLVGSGAYAAAPSSGFQAHRPHTTGAVPLGLHDRQYHTPALDKTSSNFPLTSTDDAVRGSLIY